MNYRNAQHGRFVSLIVSLLVSCLSFACGSELGFAPAEVNASASLKPGAQTFVLAGAYRLDGRENNRWYHFKIRARRDENSMLFMKRIALDRSGSSLLIEYRYKDSSTGSFHPSLQGGMWIKNGRDDNLQVEIEAQLNLGQVYGSGYAMSVARLELRSGENGGVLESLDAMPLTQIDFAEDIHFDLFPAPFMIISEGPGEIYKWDFKVGNYPEEDFLFEKVDKMRISHAFVQGPDTELEMQSWNWLTLLSP